MSNIKGDSKKLATNIITNFCPYKIALKNPTINHLSIISLPTKNWNLYKTNVDLNLYQTRWSINHKNKTKKKSINSKQRVITKKYRISNILRNPIQESRGKGSKKFKTKEALLLFWKILRFIANPNKYLYDITGKLKEENDQTWFKSKIARSPEVDCELDASWLGWGATHTIIPYLSRALSLSKMAVSQPFFPLAFRVCEKHSCGKEIFVLWRC